MISSESGGVREANSSLLIVSFMLLSCRVLSSEYYLLCQRLTTEDGRIRMLFDLEPIICFLLPASFV